MFAQWIFSVSFSKNVTSNQKLFEDVWLLESLCLFSWNHLSLYLYFQNNYQTETQIILFTWRYFLSFIGVLRIFCILRSFQFTLLSKC